MISEKLAEHTHGAEDRLPVVGRRQGAASTHNHVGEAVGGRTLRRQLVSLHLQTRPGCRAGEKAQQFRVLAL